MVLVSQQRENYLELLNKIPVFLDLREFFPNKSISSHQRHIYLWDLSLLFFPLLFSPKTKFFKLLIISHVITVSDNSHSTANFSLANVFIWSCMMNRCMKLNSICKSRRTNRLYYIRRSSRRKWNIDVDEITKRRKTYESTLHRQKKKQHDEFVLKSPCFFFSLSLSLRIDYQMTSRVATNTNQNFFVCTSIDDLGVFNKKWKRKKISNPFLRKFLKKFNISKNILKHMMALYHRDETSSTCRDHHSNVRISDNYIPNHLFVKPTVVFLLFKSVKTEQCKG